MVGKIYTGILEDRVRRVTGVLIDDDQGCFRVRRGCVDQIFTIKQKGKKVREKKRRGYVGFIDFGEAYDMDNREDFWKVLRMCDVGGKRLSGIKYVCMY